MLTKLDLGYNELSGSLLGALEELTLGKYGKDSCSLGGTNSFSCPTPDEIHQGSPYTIPTYCIASLQCSSNAVPSEQSSGAVPLWALLPVGMLLVVLILFCRHYGRISRDRSNLYASRETGPIWTCAVDHPPGCKGCRSNQTTSTQIQTRRPNDGTHLSLARRRVRSRPVRRLVLPHLLPARRQLRSHPTQRPVQITRARGQAQGRS